VDLTQAMLAALGIGILIGGGVRLLLGNRSHLGLAASILSGIVGSAIGVGTVELILGTDQLQRNLLATLLSATAGTLVVVFVANYFVRVPDPTVQELIEVGESADVEFKSSARFNRHTMQRDDRMELTIAKTVAAFSNAQGGTLLIGVDDAGSIVGLADDLKLMKHPDTDRFELWLRDFLSKTIGVAATAAIRAEFPPVANEEICFVKVPRSHRPVFLEPGKGKQPQFWVRVGNTTRELPVDEALLYASRHFSRRGFRSRA
jgi:uncharacterized membrane protein YeaQ/YmgE (transglycosylase-associated protein family)